MKIALAYLVLNKTDKAIEMCDAFEKQYKDYPYKLKLERKICSYL